MQLAELLVVVGARIDDFNKGMDEVDRRLKSMAGEVAPITPRIDTVALQKDIDTARQATEKALADANAKIQQTRANMASAFISAGDRAVGRENPDPTILSEREIEASRQLIMQKAREEIARKANMTAAEREAQAIMTAAEMERAAAKTGITLSPLGGGGRVATAQTAETIKKVEAATASADTTARRFTRSLTTLAAQAVGANPNIARLGSTLGQLAAGAAETAGILLGIAAIGFAIDKLTEKARENAKATRGAIDELDRLQQKRAQQITGTTGDAVLKAQARLDEIAEDIKTEQANRALGEANDKQALVQAADRNIATLKQEQTRLTQLVQTGQQSMQQAIKDSEISSLSSLVSVGRETAAQHARFIAILDEEKKHAADLEKNAPNTPLALADKAQTASTIASMESALRKLTPAEKEEATILREVSSAMIEYQKQQDAIKRRLDEAHEAIELRISDEKSAMDAFDAGGQVAARVAREEAEAFKAAKDAGGDMVQRYNVMQALLANFARARAQESGKMTSDIVRDGDSEAASIQQRAEATLRGTRAIEAFNTRLAGQKAVQDAVRSSTVALTDAQKASIQSAAEAVERASQAATRIQKIVDVKDSIESNIVDTLADVATNARTAGQAVVNMLLQIEQALLRFELNNRLVPLLDSVFSKIVGGASAGGGTLSGGSTPMPAGTKLGLRATPGTAAAMVVTVPVTYNISALDPRGVHEMIMENHQSIGMAAATAVKNSSALRAVMSGKV